MVEFKCKIIHAPPIGKKVTYKPASDEGTEPKQAGKCYVRSSKRRVFPAIYIGAQYRYSTAVRERGHGGHCAHHRCASAIGGG